MGMKRSLWLAALSLLMVSAFAPMAWAQRDEVTANMEDNFFDQANMTVEPGTTVTWVQSGKNPHTTTSYDGLWDPGMIESGSNVTFSFTFEKPGIYDYYCMPHESLGIVGSVTVTGSASASASASARAEAETLADTGGPSLAIAAALLLAGSGVLSFAVLRRRTS
jgi:plastocyanin